MIRFKAVGVPWQINLSAWGHVQRVAKTVGIKPAYDSPRHDREMSHW